jgi:nicotinate-nucleotide adenylyltransferase
MKVGLYFGSFNPPHRGHTSIAQCAIAQFNLDEVWLVVSPQNPFKPTSTLAPENDRLCMVQIACSTHEKLIASDVEFNMPRPSYTCATLRQLTTEFTHHFHLIMGEDNWQSFHLWKEYEWILNNFPLLIYHRSDATANSSIDQERYSSVEIINGELLHLSATEIRQRLSAHESVDNLIDGGVLQYIRDHHLYGQ